MNTEEIINQTVEFVKQTLADAEGGHDWWHIWRVWQLSKKIAETEQASRFVVELGALLHDIADSKFHDGNEALGPQKAREFLSLVGVEEADIRHVENIISHISFKGQNNNRPKSKKSQQVSVYFQTPCSGFYSFLIIGRAVTVHCFFLYT